MEEPPLKIITVKSSVNGVKWKEQFKKPLMQLVSTVNNVVAHIYSFLKFIFMHELADNHQFVLKNYINDTFFKEVFLSLLDNYKPEEQKGSENSRKFKNLILTYRLSSIITELQEKSFAALPLRKKFIPCYITVDTLILNTQILKNSVISHLDKDLIWGAVLDKNSKDMKDQSPRKVMKFRGTIMTDGIGLSIVKQNQDTKKKGAGGGVRRGLAGGKEEEEFTYIEKLEKEELLSTVGKCVLIDSGRRDLLYCMHEESSPNDKIKWRYTSSRKNVETKSKKFKKLREKFKPDEIYARELFLSDYNSATVTKSEFSKYIRQRATVSEVLTKYYSNEELSNTERKAKNLLLFLKMQLSSYINIQQSNKRLVKDFKKEFDEDAVAILGNWSAGVVKYYEPIRGIGMRRMLKKESVQVYLIDEYKTSTFCPNCNEKLEKFKTVPNPRKYMREKFPTTLSHGLLRYFFF